MPSLKPKPRSGGKWLPNQVHYGIDCSDPDPSNWTPFGEVVDRQAPRQKMPAAAAIPKPSE